MTTRTLTRLYDSHDDAVATVQALEAAGFPDDQISIVASNYAGTSGTYAASPENPSDGTRHVADHDSSKAAATGATVGTVLGGGAGLLAGIGALAIPGLGPVVAAGWLVAALAGAGVGAVVGGGAGGLVASLTHAGVPEEDAHVYAEGVRRGGSLVTIRADETRVPEAEAILNRQRSVDPAQRRVDYQRTGWTRFDEKAPAYVEADTTRPRV